MGRKPIGRRAMTNVELVRRHREKVRVAKLKRAAVRIDAVAKPVIAAVLAGGDLDGATPDTRQGCLAAADDILAGLRAAGLSIVRTSSLK